MLYDASGFSLPERVVQAPPGFEERRKANPLMRQPLRPLAGFALHTSGTRLNDQLAARFDERVAHFEVLDRRPQ